jgi:GNAT superfamily N-acetyltransferase
VGTALVAHVLATAVELNAHAAARAVVVNTINPNAHRWWEHLGFTRSTLMKKSAPTSTC